MDALRLHSASILGHLIAEHVDTDGDGDVDSSDAWRHNQYNERWQLLATWKGSDAKPSETYAHHNAGRDGRGGASYIDALICRDRDKDVDGSVVREERLYYIQNWRHDVVALIRADSASDMKVVERVRYDAYGRPSSFNPADVARAGAVIGPDGDLDNNDDIQAVSGTGAQWYNDFGTGTSGTNFLPDGTKNGFDYTAFSDAWTDPDGEYGGGGFGVLSGANLDNRVGYAGYRFDPTLNEGGGANAKPVYHVRHRVLDSTSGKWFQMDPLGYVDGASLYEYCLSYPIELQDETGLSCSCTIAARGPDDRPEIDPSRVVVPWGTACEGLPPNIYNGMRQAWCDNAAIKWADAYGITVTDPCYNSFISTFAQYCVSAWAITGGKPDPHTAKVEAWREYRACKNGNPYAAWSECMDKCLDEFDVNLGSIIGRWGWRDLCPGTSLLDVMNCVKECRQMSKKNQLFCIHGCLLRTWKEALTVNPAALTLCVYMGVRNSMICGIKCSQLSPF